MPIIACWLSSPQAPPAASTYSRRTRSQMGSESIKTPSRSKTTADIVIGRTLLDPPVVPPEDAVEHPDQRWRFRRAADAPATDSRSVQPPRPRASATRPPPAPASERRL